MNASAPEMGSYSGHWPGDYRGTLSFALDGDPKKLAEFQMAGLEQQVAQAEGAPISAVDTQAGVVRGDLNADLGSVSRLKGALAGAQERSARKKQPAPSLAGGPASINGPKPTGGLG